MYPNAQQVQSNQYFQHSQQSMPPVGAPGGPSQMSQINEPTITGRVVQMQDHMALAEQHAAILRGHLFGEGEQSCQRQPPTTIRGMLDDLSARLASLCGELATINQRIGCTPEPSPSNFNQAPIR